MLSTILQNFCQVDNHCLSLRFHAADFLEKRAFLSVSPFPQRHTDRFFEKDIRCRQRDDENPDFFQTKEMFLRYDFERYAIEMQKEIAATSLPMTIYLDKITHPLPYSIITVKQPLESGDETSVLTVLQEILEMLEVSVDVPDLKCTHSKAIYMLRCSPHFRLYSETEKDIEIINDVKSTIRALNKKEEEEEDEDTERLPWDPAVKSYLWENGRQDQYIQRLFRWDYEVEECYELVMKYRTYVLETPNIFFSIPDDDFF